MMNSKFTIFGFSSNSTDLNQLQFVKNYDTKEEAFNDIINLEKRFGYSHFVIYGEPNFKCNNELFQFHGWFNCIVQSRRIYDTGTKIMSWSPTKYFTNDYKTFYFQ
jgi:hypothetical protein